jgi:uncharacterized protein
MIIGVVSDTHGHVEHARQAARMLESQEVVVVLHCGDVGSAAIVPLFATWPTHFVLGNVDGGNLASAIEGAGKICHGRFGSLELGGVRIALVHGDDQKKLQEAIVGGTFDLVCHGHTHVPRVEKIGKTLVLNPGALYRASRHTIAVVELPSLTATIIPV